MTFFRNDCTHQLWYLPGSYLSTTPSDQYTFSLRVFILGEMFELLINVSYVPFANCLVLALSSEFTVPIYNHAQTCTASRALIRDESFLKWKLEDKDFRRMEKYKGKNDPPNARRGDTIWWTDLYVEETPASVSEYPVRFRNKPRLQEARIFKPVLT